MKYLFVLGNGFDLNLGLKTKYAHFYDYYQDIEAKSEKIRLLKEKIKNDIETWSDLESALGLYTRHISSFDEYEEIRKDLLVHLSSFLNAQENLLDYDNFRVEEFFNDLLSPERYLKPADVIQFQKFQEKRKTEGLQLNIISFNYTRVIERMLKRDYFDFQIPGYGQRSIVLKSLEHVHGTLENRMILGVNDVTQVANERLHTDRRFLNAFIKPESNRVSKELVDSRCEKLIETSQLICIFGSSLGKSDRNWWDLIARQLVRDCRLIIFKKVDNYSSKLPDAFSFHEETVKSEFLNNTSLSASEKSAVIDNIFVGISTSIFQKILNETKSLKFP